MVELVPLPVLVIASTWQFVPVCDSDRSDVVVVVVVVAVVVA